MAVGGMHVRITWVSFDCQPKPDLLSRNDNADMLNKQRQLQVIRLALSGHIAE